MESGARSDGISHFACILEFIVFYHVYSPRRELEESAALGSLAISLPYASHFFLGWKDVCALTSKNLHSNLCSHPDDSV
jgi:hypothetical protein